MRTKTWLGWTTITDTELAAAQRATEAGEQGVRDEIGIGAIHSLYADRFFPGTSVLMTRLRYVFFVAAAYEKYRREPVHRTMDVEIAEIERRTALQLSHHYARHGVLEGLGIIGWTVAKSRHPVQLPSMSYWTALSRWTVLAADAVGGAPSRSAVHANWDCYRRQSTRGEIRTQSPLFHPELEERWRHELPPDLRNIGNEASPLTFELSEWERAFLRSCIAPAAGHDRRGIPLIARLANLTEARLRRAGRASAPWADEIMRELPPDHPDRGALLRAERAAHLVQIARAAYDVLVARLIRDRDKLADSGDAVMWAEEHLAQLVDSNSHAHSLARELEIEMLCRDGEDAEVGLDSGLIALLDRTKTWLIKGDPDPSPLRDTLREREVWKKTKARARLVPESHDQRRSWKFRPASALDYRWSVVGRLLLDLAGERR